MMEKVRIKDKMRSAYSPQQWLGVQIENIRDYQIEKAVDILGWEIREAYYREPGKYDWIDKEWKPFEIGAKWGGDDYTSFFRTKLVIPEEFDAAYTVLLLKPGGEGLMRIEIKPFAGLDSKHVLVFLSNSAKAGAIYNIEIEQTVNEMEVFKTIHAFEYAKLAILDREIENAYFDFKCLFDLISTPQTDSQVVAFIYAELKKALALVNFDDSRETFKSTLMEAQALLRKNVYDSGKYFHEGRLNMVGHSHLDLVYQWDYNEFQRKIGRTHSTTLNVMREFPQYLFCQSQLKLYEDLQRLYPEVYDGIKQKVQENRWEVIGGMYVEPDCNLISGESFVRQLFHGNKITREEFGEKSTVCWLPDVFGIAWFIPQILKRTGFKYLITNKPVIWNDTNEFPHNTFWWEGPDGSRIMAHLPSTHFGAKIDADIMLTNWNEYKQKIACREVIYNYGYADGRGGPNRDDILTGLRYEKTPGMPAAQFTHGEEAFDRMAAVTGKLPVMKNELYLETHRGTYTTQARLKKNNRRAEILYRNAEAASVKAEQFGGEYPHDKLDEGWKLILKNQFHDILPGSHVTEAYHAAMKDYDEIFKIGQEVLRSSLIAVAKKIAVAGDEQSFAVFNFQTWERSDLAKIEIDRADIDFGILENNQPVDMQIVSQYNSKVQVQFLAQNIPSMGYKVFNVVDKPTSGQENKAFDSILENQFFKIVFDVDGAIVEIFDKKNNRQLVEQGAKANEFQMFKDVPGRYAAWDIVPMYKEHEFAIGPVEKSELIESGAVRTVLRQERTFFGSALKQNIIVYNHIPRIDFETEIDWQERDRLLKVAFPVTVNAMSAAYDISYGYIERPTHQNTAWDAAKFEVAGHMWADLSEGDYGVSILNDCKYGHDISGNTIRLTLLKGPQYPDPKADLGSHFFTYSLYPHAGDWRSAKTPQKAWELNDQMIVVELEKNDAIIDSTESFLMIDKEHVLLSALKVSDDGEGVVIRLYEDQNRRGEVNVQFSKTIKGAVECDPYENEIGPVLVKNDLLTFDIKPFEVRTFKLYLDV
jgi:alpha-mannosidase